MAEETDTNRSVLSTHNLKKRYKKRTVVDDVSIEVGSGEVVGLLGPNGAGKTTCFYMVVGLVPCDSGDIYLDGKRITHLPIHTRARLGVSYLPQEASVFRKMTVTENIKAVLELQGLPSEEVELRTEQLLEELHILHIRNSQAASLSGGERRRVEIARCLAVMPEFILLDEPFSGIDPIAVYDIQQIILDLRRKGFGILLTDHNVRDTLAITDRACLIHQGQIVVEGTPKEVASSDVARRFYLGDRFSW